MNRLPNPPNRRPRFTIRAVLMLTLLVALIVGWRSSLQRAAARLAQQEHRLEFAERELERTRDQLKDEMRMRRDSTRTFAGACFDKAQLPDVTISSPGNAFQRSSFEACNLRNTSLQGGVAAFQLARFDRSNLVDAKLTGANASFQGATFVGADLTGAVLLGSGSAFQGSSLEDATLIRARLAGSFQGANVSGAHFEGADLSALDSESLVSCYFKEAPTYDDKTRFPTGFDPATNGWHRR